MLEQEINREKLKEKYGDEIIYVFTPDLFANFTDLFNPVDENFLNKINDEGFFISRFMAEYNQNLLQPIAYILLINENTGKYLVTRRIGGEERLLNKLAFVGGHVSSLDSKKTNIIKAAAYRELNEEIKYISKDDKKFKFHGIIKDVNSSTADHIGFVFTKKVSYAEVKETENLEAIWMDSNELIQNANLFESWAQIVIMGKKLIHQ